MIGEQDSEGKGWHWISAWIVLVSALVLSGCGSGSQTPLPELTRLPTKLLSPQEQKQAIGELEAERARLDAEAAKSRAEKQ